MITRLFGGLDVRSIRSACAVLLAALAGFASTVAHATETGTMSLGQCTDKSNYVCGWTSTSWRGGFHWWGNSVSDTGPGIESIWNRKADAVLLYSQTGYRGSTRWVNPGQQLSDAPWPVRSIAMDPCFASLDIDPAVLAQNC